jgi:CheY-like chemotaxis protein
MASVLLVDDERFLLDFVSMVLRQAGHDVLSASNGVEALMIFSSYRSGIDLVLTDIVMPSMNGVELAGRLRALNPELPILLMSGFVPDDITVPDNLQLLQKPFQPSQLLEAIRQSLATAGQRLPLKSGPTPGAKSPPLPAARTRPVRMAADGIQPPMRSARQRRRPD